MAFNQQRLGHKRDGVDDEPSAGAQRRDGVVEHARLAGAAADEDRIGRRESGERGRCLAVHDLEARHPKAAALRAIRAARSARASIAIARIRRVGQQPFDRNRTGAGTDVPQSLAAPGR